MSEKNIYQRINEAYQMITERLEAQKQRYKEKNIYVSRVTYEDVQLEDVLDDILLPLLSVILDVYSGLDYPYQRKCHRIYIATLCEIVKNGLLGGILKTIESRIGDFDRNHHYAVLKDALKSERIEVIEKPRRYEETIIYEAGIPRGYRSICLEFFKLYWKWLRNYNFGERENFLHKFLNEEPLEKIYIVDGNDMLRLLELRKKTSSFSEKLIKTCVKFDRVFSAIDSYPGSITIDTIDEVAEDISATVGFDILSVVHTKAVKQYILEYAKQVSFSKFLKIKENLPDGEMITLPNGSKRRNDNYQLSQMQGGVHYIRGNAYEVSFPTSLSVDDLFSLELRKPLVYGTSVVYVSDEPIEAVIDGYTRSDRLFFDAQKRLRYVFYERVMPGSYVYLDGIPVQSLERFSHKTFVCKYWDSDIKHYKLALCVGMIRFADVNQSMYRVSLICNGKEIVTGQTNSRGSYRIQDKLVPLDKISFDSNLHLRFCVNSELVEEWTTIVLPMYIWGKQSGTRVYSEIDLSQWYGMSSIVIFSKIPIDKSNAQLKHLYDEQGYSVYEGSFDKDASALKIQDTSIPIIAPTLSYIELLSEYEILSERICIRDDKRLSIAVHNLLPEDNSQILLIEHDDVRQSYNLRHLSDADLQDVFSLLPGADVVSVVGKWKIVLFQNNSRISELEVVVLPNIAVKTLQDVYVENEDVVVKLIASSNCFEDEGEFTNSKTIIVGKPMIELRDKEVVVTPIEFSYAIDKCEIIECSSIIPKVWSVRVRDTSRGEWMSSKVDTIQFTESSSNDVFIVASKEVMLRFLKDGEVITQQKYIGCCKLNILQLLKKSGIKTRLTVSDENDVKKTLNIIIPVRVTATTEIEYTYQGVIIPVSYYGPIGVSLELRAFSGRTMVFRGSKSITNNRFLTQIIIDRSSVSDAAITVEARIEKQDFQQILNCRLDLKRLESRSRNVFSFSRETTITDILSFRSDSNDGTFPHLIIELLEQGGFE